MKTEDSPWSSTHRGTKELPVSCWWACVTQLWYCLCLWNREGQLSPRAEQGEITEEHLTRSGWEETRPALLAVQEYRESRTWAFHPGWVISPSDENAEHIPVLSYLKVMINLWSCTESAWKGSHTQDVRMALCHPQGFAFSWQPFPEQLH